MKKIVLLSERLPYPPTSGTKNLLYNYCKILHEKLNLEVINISFLEQDENISAKPDFISRVYTMPNPSGKTKLKNIEKSVDKRLETWYSIKVAAITADSEEPW